MTITDSLIRIKNAKDNLRQSLINKGISIPNDALLDEYSSIIDETELYGPYYKNFYDMRTNNGTNMNALFARTTGELDLRQLDVSQVTSMQYMFDSSTANVNIDGWDTSKVENMSYMFQYFTGSVDISKLDTSSVTNVIYMLYYINTDNIILTGLSFPSTTSLGYMFYNAKGTVLDLSSWGDVSHITNMNNMFNSAEHKKIDLTGWKTTNVTDMSNMFYSYSNRLEKLIIPDWDMTNTTSYSNFYYVGNSSNKNTLRLVDLSRSNDVTITKITSFLPTRTNTTFGDVIVPSNTSQEVYDSLIAKYWRPVGADLTPVPTSAEIIAELDDIRPGQTTKVYIGAWEPWYADPDKCEIVMISDESIATMEGDTITSTGVIGDILLEARIRDTQEVVGTKTIPVSEEDLSPNVIKFRASEVRTDYTNFTVNGTAIKGNNTALKYNKDLDLYIYDVGVPITSLKFNSSYCKLTEIVKLNTSSMTTMERMLEDHKELISLNIDFDSSNSNSMSLMFCNCNSLISLNSSEWDTSNIKKMQMVFQGCSSLVELDLSGWNTSNSSEMNNMFQRCTNLAILDISNFDMTNVTSNVYRDYMFDNCYALHTLRLDNCSNDTIRKIITSSSFPTNAIDGVTRTIYCKEEEAWDLTPPTNWVFEYIKEELPEPEPCPNCGEIDCDGSCYDHGGGGEPEICPNCGERDCDGSCYDEGEGGEIALYNFGQFRDNNELTEVSVMVVSEHDNLEEMFVNCHSLTTIIGIDEWDTSNVMRMTDMFKGCESLESLDLSSFNTENVENMERMFKDCHNLRELDIRSFNTERVDNMNEMFNCCCENLESLDLSNFNTGNVRNMERMFADCRHLRELNISRFNTTNVEEMREMFQGCESLESLDLSSFNTENVRNMERMFADCNKLRYLNLSNFNTDNTENINEMFGGCHDLIELRLDNCGRETINWIISSGNLPEGYVFDFDLGEYTTRKIYCKESEIENWMIVHLPNGWEFIYVDGDE